MGSNICDSHVESQQNESPWQGRTAESLTEEWLKTGDDAILDVLKAGDEDFIHRTLGPRVQASKAEIAAPLDFHLHVVFNQVGVASEGYCIHVTEVQVLAKLNEPAIPILERDEKFNVLVVAEGQIRGSVLVSVTQRVENPQGVQFSRVLRPTVRLQSIDQCARTFRHALQGVPTRSDVLTTVFEDGEVATTATTARLAFANETANEIVQRGSKIEEKVTDNDAQFDRWKRVLAVNDQPMIGAFLIDLSDKGRTCLFHKLGSVNLERAEMYFGSGDLGVNTLHPRQGVW